MACKRVRAGLVLAALLAAAGCLPEDGAGDGDAGDAAGGTGPTGGSGGTGGVVVGSTGGSAGTGGVVVGGAGGTAGGSDCDTMWSVYADAVGAAQRCDPAAAVPCTEYRGIRCPQVGVNPDSVAALSAQLSDYEAAGCHRPLLNCLIYMLNPPPYTCQATASGTYMCYSVCEQMAAVIGGTTSCVSRDCGNALLYWGFCSGTSQCCWS
jgi:hypothetical protein